MASSINASTSGAGGVITTADNSGILNLQSGGTTVATVQSSGLSLPTGSTFNAANTFGFENRLINGNMIIDQRNAGAVLNIPNAVTTYTLDRWALFENGSMAFSVQQSTTVPAGFKNSILITTVTGAAAGADTRSQFFQRIEGYNVADLGWGTANAKTITLSFWVRSSLTGQFGGALQNNTSDRSYPFSYTISAANTFEYKTITIPGDTTGTWLTGNDNGVFVNFDVGMGANLLGTAGSWSSSDYRGATGDVKLSGTTGATLYLTGVQFEVGSQATSFDFRSIGQEYALCCRYYTTSYAYQNTYITSAGYAGVGVTLAVPMRTFPTVTTITDSSSNLGTVNYTYSGPLIAATSVVIVYAPGAAIGGAALNASFSASAEL